MPFDSRLRPMLFQGVDQGLAMRGEDTAFDPYAVGRGIAGYTLQRSLGTYGSLAQQSAPLVQTPQGQLRKAALTRASMRRGMAGRGLGSSILSGLSDAEYEPAQTAGYRTYQGLLS